MDLYTKLNGATLQHSIVFKPTQFASRISGTNAYQLKLDAVRAWCNQYLS